jgi:hypothetical protein
LEMVSSYYYIFVLIMLYVSSYYYICVRRCVRRLLEMVESLGRAPILRGLCAAEANGTQLELFTTPEGLQRLHAMVLEHMRFTTRVTTRFILQHMCPKYCCIRALILLCVRILGARRYVLRARPVMACALSTVG